MGAAIWSTSSKGMLEFPAVALLSFFKNHGLLSLKDRPRWQTVVGGSYSYVKKFQQEFKGAIRLDSAVISVIKTDQSFEVTTAKGVEEFDLVISALHANRVLDVFKALPNEIEQEFSCLLYTSPSPRD